TVHLWSTLRRVTSLWRVLHRRPDALRRGGGWITEKFSQPGDPAPPGDPVSRSAGPRGQQRGRQPDRGERRADRRPRRLVVAPEPEGELESIEMAGRCGPQPQPPAIQTKPRRGYLHGTPQPRSPQGRQGRRVRRANPDVLLDRGDAGHRESTGTQLSVQHLSAPQLVDDHGYPGGAAHPDDLTRPGQQPFEIGRRGRRRLDPEERELPGYPHAGTSSKSLRRSAEATFTVSSPALPYSWFSVAIAWATPA